MTVVVSVKINDGVVMAADSAGSMPSGQVYAHANKTANLWVVSQFEIWPALNPLALAGAVSSCLAASMR